MMTRLLPAALLALALSSCYGTKEFTIRTDPEGAQVAINGKPCKEGKTPLTVTIPQDRDLGITVTKPGYEVATQTVPTQTSTWGAILWNSHDPRAQYIAADEITIPLKKIPSAATFTPTSMPGYQPPTGISESSIPELRPMPEF